MNRIEQYTKKNREFLEKLEALLVKIEIFDSNQRNMLLIGFVRNALSHYFSINLLIEKKLYNSAFALVRVLFENIVRGEYVYHILDDAKISVMFTSQNWEFVKFRKICQALDAHYGIDSFVKITNTAYKNMNDYTHTGANQIARNFNEATGQVEADFSEDLICDTLEGNFILFKTFSIFLLEIGLHQENITEEELEEIFHFDLKH